MFSRAVILRNEQYYVWYRLKDHVAVQEFGCLFHWLNMNGNFHLFLVCAVTMEMADPEGLTLIFS